MIFNFYIAAVLPGLRPLIGTLGRYEISIKDWARGVRKRGDVIKGMRGGATGEGETS